MTASILYIHGLNSSPASHKASQLSRAMAHLGLENQLRVPALHHHPRQAMAQLQALISELGSPLLVGSSLGGYYATYLAEQHGLNDSKPYTYLEESISRELGGKTKVRVERLAM